MFCGCSFGNVPEIATGSKEPSSPPRVLLRFVQATSSGDDEQLVLAEVAATPTPPSRIANLIEASLRHRATFSVSGTDAAIGALTSNPTMYFDFDVPAGVLTKAASDIRIAATIDGDSRLAPAKASPALCVQAGAPCVEATSVAVVNSTAGPSGSYTVPLGHAVQCKLSACDAFGNQLFGAEVPAIADTVVAMVTVRSTKASTPSVCFYRCVQGLRCLPTSVY